jgi:hypothetical protein
VIAKNAFVTGEECAAFFAILFEENLSMFFWHSLEFASKFPDHLDGPGGFCDEVSHTQSPPDPGARFCSPTSGHHRLSSHTQSPRSDRR